MAVLAIHLQEGFQDDAVIIRTDGRERARREHVTTRLLVGHAETVELESSAPGPVRLEVALPNRQIAGSTTLSASGDVFVGVNVEGGTVVFAVQDRPFTYA
jgi:hypothetical protein